MNRNHWNMLIPFMIFVFGFGSVCFYLYGARNARLEEASFEDARIQMESSAVSDSASFESAFQTLEVPETNESITVPDAVASSEPQSQEEAKDDSTEWETGIVTDGTVYEKLMSGNFACLMDDDWEAMERVYHIMAKNGTAEWRQIDLNGDGTDDLILQEAWDNWGDIKSIAGIFDCKEGQEKCVFWDVNDYSEFMFCGGTGELMYYASYYGGVLSMEPYTHYYYDTEWNRIEDYTIIAYRIEASENEPIGEDWVAMHPDMAENGDYYRKYVGDDETGEILTFSEFVSIYETETGFAFDNSYFGE